MKSKFLLLLFVLNSTFLFGDERAANLVILDPIGVENLQIKLADAEEAAFEETVFALGRIDVLPGNRALISSRIPGRVQAVNIKPDHPIQKGEVAVVVESRQPGNPPPTVTLEAPISGMVSHIAVVPGEPVDPDKALVEIMDLSEVYAVARVPQYQAGVLRVGQKARITVSALPGKAFEAKIEHLGTEADLETGTVEAAFHVENLDGLLRPGMRAEFNIVTSERDAVVAVPKEAVQGEPSNRFVFVADFELENAFVKVPVVTGAQNDEKIEILKGLLPGDRVVTHGAYALTYAGKGSVSLKAAMDAAHGHPHAEDGSELPGNHGTPAESGHSHSAFTPLTLFFAATTGVLLVLVIGLFIFRRHA